MAHRFSMTAFLVLCIAAAGCGGEVDRGDDDTGTGTQGDTSGDAGGDTDSDSDADSDADSDSDSDTATCDSGSFNFFVMSLEAIQKLSGSDEGLGGNLGGLAGADAKCQAAANDVGACDKKWVAFLSVTDDGTGKPVNAIDRIGTGPWYDVNGHLFAQNVSELLKPRPGNDTDPVWNDGFQDWPFFKCLTTEKGNCNHSYGDTHDTLTGSNRQGQLYSTDKKYTCNDWTSTDMNVQLPVGHSWPRRINGTDPGETHWLYAHSNCSGGGPGPAPSGNCNGCAANINISDSFEEGVGGDGGYGAWYCFGL